VRLRFEFGKLSLNLGVLRLQLTLQVQIHISNLILVRQVRTIVNLRLNLLDFDFTLADGVQVLLVLGLVLSPFQVELVQQVLFL